MNEQQYFKVKDLSESLGLSISNINIQIIRGNAGEVLKSSEGETSDYLLTLDNVLKLLRWFQIHGRGNKKMLMETLRHYKGLKENAEID